MMWRNSYYFGILLLVLYSMIKIDFVVDNLYPILHIDLIPGLPLISAVGLFIGFSAYMAYKYRRLG